MRQVFVAIALLLVLFAAPVRAETQLERGRYLVETSPAVATVTLRGDRTVR
jgi:hypothetical protein